MNVKCYFWQSKEIIRLKIQYIYKINIFHTVWCKISCFLAVQSSNESIKMLQIAVDIKGETEIKG